MDEALKLVSLVFTGLGIFAGAFAPVFPDYTSILAATAAGCGGISALCQKTLSSGQAPVPTSAPAPVALPPQAASPKPTTPVAPVPSTQPPIAG